MRLHQIARGSDLRRGDLNANGILLPGTVIASRVGCVSAVAVDVKSILL